MKLGSLRQCTSVKFSSPQSRHHRQNAGGILDSATTRPEKRTRGPNRNLAPNRYTAALVLKCVLRFHYSHQLPGGKRYETDSWCSFGSRINSDRTNAQIPEHAFGFGVEIGQLNTVQISYTPFTRFQTSAFIGSIFQQLYTTQPELETELVPMLS